MALQIRRGPTADRMSYTPVVGELVWDTSTNSLYIGNGTTAGGLPAGTLNTEDVQDIASSMLTSGVHQNITFTYNDTLGSLNAQLDLTTYDGTIEAAAFKGSVFANNSTLLVDAVNGTLRGPVIADSVIIGNELDPGLELIEESAILSTIAARPTADLQLSSNGVTIGSDTENNFLRVFSVGVVNSTTLALNTFVDSAASNFLTLTRARGTALTPLPLVLNDVIYRIRFAGSDGTANQGSGQITCDVDNVVSSGIVPGRLNFLTADSAGVLRNALQITSAQDVRIITSLSLDNSSGTLSANQSGQTSRVLQFSRSRGNSTVPTASLANDHIYTLRFNGYDGTADRIAAQIRAEVSLTPTAGVVPGRLRFLTANSAGVQTTALLIDEAQTVQTNADLRVAGTIFGNVDGDLTGSVFADDSTMIIDGTNGTIPGYISVVALKTLASTSATYADFQTAIAAL